MSGRLPTFLIIGAQKAGTSWLADMLSQHPEVFMVPYEIHYFDKDFNFSKGIEWYKAHFSGVKDEKAIGEKTPDYLWANGRGVEGHLPDVHKNIYKTLPDAKLIVILRNPVERAISAINHIIASGRISPFHSIDDLLLGKKHYLISGHGVIEYGMYYQQIVAYLEYFKREQLLILIFEEDVIKNQSSSLRKVCDFVGVEPDFNFSNTQKKINVYSKSKPRLIFDYYFPFLKPFTGVIDKLFPLSKQACF